MAETNTNRQALPDFDAFFKNQGKPIGYVPTDAEMELAKAVLVPVTKELMMRQFAQPTNIATAGTLTNDVTKEVYPVAKDGMGRIVQMLKPEVLQTDTGIQYISGPGTTRNFINEETGERPKGYVASGSFYAGNQPMVGPDNSAARSAATAATTGTNTNKPVGPYTLTNSAGRVMTFADPYQVRAAFKRNELTQDEARRAASHFPLPQQPNR